MSEPDLVERAVSLIVKEKPANRIVRHENVRQPIAVKVSAVSNPCPAAVEVGLGSMPTILEVWLLEKAPP